MTVTSLVAVVTPHKANFLKMAPVFLEEEKICYKMV